MIELPEAIVLSRQISDSLSGRTICEAVAAQSPHKFAWYSGDPAAYSDRLERLTVTGSESHGGHVWVGLDSGASLIFGEGACLKHFGANEPAPKKHQLLLVFDDETKLVVTVQMYAFLGLHDGSEPLNPYIERGILGPNPLAEEFDLDAFCEMVARADNGKLSVKALLATEQRLPGVGNGVLQDILFAAGLNPRRRIGALTEEELTRLHSALQDTLLEMVALGGRDTETDLYGAPGSYATKMSRHTVDRPCAVCGTTIVKQAYLGGSVYFCPTCQPV